VRETFQLDFFETGLHSHGRRKRVRCGGGGKIGTGRNDGGKPSMSIFRFQGGLLYTVAYDFERSKQRKKGGIGSRCKNLVTPKKVRKGGGI
jgi:hypothetical protein